ncbi:queuosine precursor transporter [Candidatus Leptofilum sp.]|uniref:queuosine precursor transporter n=1 Tax=Candidatus Leptofilum sp. TaxID=3241576 RepID=UPI003B5CACE7
MTVLTQTKGKQESAKAAATAVPVAAVIVVACYIGAQMLSDITSLKIGLVAGYAVDMGTFIYPITFTLRDLAHKTLGKRNAQALIVMAAVINLFMAAYLAWAASVPSDPTWGLGAEFSAILGPLWRIVIASILAELVSELIDTEAYHWFVTRVTQKYQWARVLFSNSISVPIDNVIFAVGAFGPLPFLQDHFLTLPWAVVWQIFVFNLVVKYGMTLISLPLIYLTPKTEK